MDASARLGYRSNQGKHEENYFAVPDPARLRGVITEYEIETVATRSRADGLIFDIDGLSAASEVMNYAPRPEQLASREDVLEAALHYPEGLKVYDGQIYAV